MATEAANKSANSSESVLSFLAKNKYISGGVLASLVSLVLFFVMVLLISLGDSGIKDDKSVKLVDIVMPERDIDTLLAEVDKPDEPEERQMILLSQNLNFSHLRVLMLLSQNPKQL